MQGGNAPTGLWALADTTEGEGSYDPSTCGACSLWGRQILHKESDNDNRDQCHRGKARDAIGVGVSQGSSPVCLWGKIRGGLHVEVIVKLRAEGE